MTDETPQTPDPEVVELAGRLFDAARSGDAELLAAYLAAGAPADLSNERGDSLLMLAAYHGHAAAVAALLKHGAAADRANDRGQTPLAGAVFKGHDEVVTALLDGGADPTAGTPSALDTARMFGKDELVARFESR
ncbi:ankyrin repeat domain-containing protein [Kitasatospora sp. DSM 101779]|uniref:ankyrin repeat domain-containing protein n=1 Tax=Kitasatospora sp. DSM 101779 TaxID=2853165 RepID=UPI0021D9CD65|nr:ankyrin repeat domain-containing protein [Kitasatospora sp. DSM 101779]MCU7821357.1 ankyrin repeat domain-containing protein [Kitasatospora sp. DSM 101779]